LTQLLSAAGSEANHSLLKLPTLISIVLLQLERQQLFDIVFILLKLGFHVDTTQFEQSRHLFSNAKTPTSLIPKLHHLV
jgi:hypothetical protein